MHRFVAALLAAASCAGVAQAQTSPPVEAGEVLTLDSALAQAGVSSPQATAATAGIRAAEAGRTVAGLRPNPSVSAQSENVVGSGPYRGFDQAETTVTFSMPLELGGKRGARIGVADARIGRAELEAAITRADVRLRVTQAYIEAVAADRRLIIARDQLRIANESLRVARDRVMVGESSPIDEQRTSVAQINAQTGLERAERGFQVARDNLALLLGQPLAGPLDQAWFDRVRAVGPEMRPTGEGTLAYAAASADLLIAGANVRLARSQRVPDLTLSAGARRFSATGGTAAVLGISVPLPFFNNGRASVSQANAELNQAGARRRAIKLDAEQDIAIVQRDRDNAAASVRASGPALAAAMEAARIARLGYGQGKFDQLVLLDAERTLAETRDAAVDALAQYHDAEARLARLIAPAPASSGDNQ
ncbi:TolC family protein [Sphingomonas sp. QA11]|uniref:TolC family protein n=1 Tax=Sphingomonas sp. QA11 TaxID=2950605 RepID=UPI00234A81EE|nr:TolC family protein [Sphingomonas sp. QA11]WCM26112.1 TolC family protein [Sphingomonas sp. QA11]